jgi:hypothetical protein
MPTKSESKVESTLALTAETYEEIKSKLIAVGYQDVRVVTKGQQEFLILDGIGLIKGDDKDLRCFLVYKGKKI